MRATKVKFFTPWYFVDQSGWSIKVPTTWTGILNVQMFITALLRNTTGIYNKTLKGRVFPEYKSGIPYHPSPDSTTQGGQDGCAMREVCLQEFKLTSREFNLTNIKTILRKILNRIHSAWENESSKWNSLTPRKGTMSFEHGNSLQRKISWFKTHFRSMVSDWPDWIKPFLSYFVLFKKYFEHFLWTCISSLYLYLFSEGKFLPKPFEPAL